MKAHRWWIPLPALRLTIRNVEKTLCGILAVAALGNVFVIKSSFEVTYLQWAMFGMSSVTFVVLTHRFFDKTKVSIPEIYASLLSAGIWVAQIVEITTSPFGSNWGKTRGGLITLSLFLLSAFLYFMQRIVRDTRLEVWVVDDP